MSTPYDSFAWFYDRYWATPFREWQTPALEKLLFPKLASSARILDVCCGTGHLAKQLSDLGHIVTGLDSSSEMLRFARENVPGARFIHADARKFTVKEQMDAVLCTFDSLNHLMKSEDVALAFGSVHAALRPGGHFVFDINTTDGYGEHWGRSACEVSSDGAFFLRGEFDAQARIGTTRITMFRFLDSWQRSDVEVHQRPWEVEEMQRLLAAANFTAVESHRAFEDLGMMGRYGAGRVYFSAAGT